MFIETKLEDSPGLNDEKKVWEEITNVFQKEDTIAIHHFPMFFPNTNGRREIDILIVNRKLGVCVIEVKGLTIDQIEKIQAHTWYYNDFYEDQGNPYQQAENQLLMLCNDMERNPILYRRLSKKAIVALPNITKQEWINRGFDKKINVPIPIFKDDLSNPKALLKKLSSNGIYETNQELTELEWSQIKDYFEIMESNKSQNFSHLYIINKSNELDKYISSINEALYEGVKVYLLSYDELDLTLIDNWSRYKDKFQLVYCLAEKKTDNLQTNVYKDGGNLTESMKEIIKHDFPNFNIGQYNAIHEPVDANQIITAGAGTGKTHVMIDRILYLLSKGICLQDIIMITFTNASTAEMKKRLEDRLIELFDLTNNTKYLFYAEQVKDMQISTIHSFARSIIKTLAHEIGFGQNVKLRSYTHEKQTIVHDLMNEFFMENSIEEFTTSGIKDYEFVQTVLEMWEEMEKKGLSRNEIETLDWGNVDDKSRFLQRLLKFIFELCEKRIDEIKKRDNALTIGDLIRKLKEFTNNESRMTQLNKGKFIFVDEFQDSDNVQIELLVCLQRYLDYKLFVVGDIKQAIYRFRGADYKSFEQLRKQTRNVKYSEISLQHNYRSTASLLSKMHPVFIEWGQRGWLSYNEKDRLIGTKQNNIKNDWNIIEPTELESSLKKALKTLPDKCKMALIVRTNKQARKMKELCKSLKIPTSENLDGTFYTSLAVKHFKALLDGLLYPNEPKFLINALETPYFGYSIPYRKLIQFGGNKTRIIRFINDHIGDDFTRYVDDIRNLSTMTVIQKIIREKNLFARIKKYFEVLNMEEQMPEEELAQNLKRYEKNLQHLMTIIEQNFASDNLSLYSLNKWLSLQISTNRTENEPIIEEGVVQVEITTVHRSKGLEYHTVFLPETTMPFDAVEPDFYLEENSSNTPKNSDEKRRFGWKISEMKNSNFYTLKKIEDNELKKEETRLLYVALTRAEERLFICMPENKKIYPNTWAGILSVDGVLKGADTE